MTPAEHLAPAMRAGQIVAITARAWDIALPAIRPAIPSAWRWVRGGSAPSHRFLAHSW